MVAAESFGGYGVSLCRFEDLDVCLVSTRSVFWVVGFFPACYIYIYSYGPLRPVGGCGSMARLRRQAAPYSVSQCAAGNKQAPSKPSGEDPGTAQHVLLEAHWHFKLSMYQKGGLRRRSKRKNWKNCTLLIPTPTTLNHPKPASSVHNTHWLGHLPSQQSSFHSFIPNIRFICSL